MLVKLPRKPPTTDNVMGRCYLGVILLYGRLGYKCILFLVPCLWMKLLSVSYNDDQWAAAASASALAHEATLSGGSAEEVYQAGAGSQPCRSCLH